ncbi:MAG: hypothetical protein Q4Q22_07250 [Methanosphaera sp.]|nr:hypothetical protein [Methanosphaera sp.]
MNKKAIIFLIALLAVIGIIALLLGGPSYSENSGTVVPAESNLTFKYNNDYSSTYYVDYYGGASGSAYYDNKTLNGSLTLDLSSVSWDDDYVPVNTSARSDVGYAKEYFMEDISENFDTLNKDVDVTYYDENGTEVYLTDYSINQEPISYNLTLDSNKLKVDLFKDYQKDYVTNITDGSTVKGPLIAGNATDTNTVKSAKVEIKLYNDEFCYYLDVDVPSDKLKSEHF